jgi:hypothetical protein
LCKHWENYRPRGGKIGKSEANTYFDEDGSPKKDWEGGVPLAISLETRQNQNLADGDWEDLLGRLLKFAPEVRLPASEACSHAWFDEVS